MSDDNSSSESDDQFETADEQGVENESEETQSMICTCERCSSHGKNESDCCRQIRKVDKECQDKG